MDRLDLFLLGMFSLPLIGAEGRLAWHASGNYSLVEVCLTLVIRVDMD
jgi:hypothetical protein